MDFAAPPSARLCIYTHSGQYTYRVFFCHGGLMMIQELAILFGNIGRKIRFARLCLKLYLLKVCRFYKAEPGIFPGVDILRLC